MAKAKERIAKVAKAGRRAAPSQPGKHRTSAEDRTRGRWVSKFGMKFYGRLLQATG